MASLARTAPVDLGLVSDLQLGIADLIAAIKSMATPAQLKQIADERHVPAFMVFSDRTLRDMARRPGVVGLGA